MFVCHLYDTTKLLWNKTKQNAPSDVVGSWGGWLGFGWIVQMIHGRQTKLMHY